MTTQSGMMAGDREAEREALRSVIQQWNADRLDLFELSEPNEDLLFHGVMRFYFHDSGQHVTTKCIRVASDATVTAVIETLIEKFRPDMRMLSVPEYALYVTHENGDERRLSPDEKPLLVQLNWVKDDREGRFLLKRIGDDTAMPPHTFQESSFRRKLSKREKKQLKKQEKLKRVKSTENEDQGKVAEKLYTELPETSFTRSISNPEAVMRRRRHQKLERKLQQFRSKDGGPDTGGTLKIYGEALCGDVPYKTLLLSVQDSAASVIREMLLKYGRDQEEASNYCLVQVNSHDGTELILDEDECPLAILMHHPATSGSIMFHVRRRPADYHPRKRKKKPQQRLDYRYEDSLPFFLELNPDGSEIMSGTPRRHVLHPNVTEVGSERTGGPHLQLFGPNIQPRHCVIAHTDGLVTVTPCSRDAEVFVNGQRIFETSILQNGAVVKFGRIHSFRFIDPAADDLGRARHQEFPYDRLSKDDTASTGTGTGPNGANGTSNASNYETTFDVDGNVETVSLKDMDARSQRSVASSRDGNRVSNYERYPRGSDPILPAVLEVREETEDAFLQAVILDLDHAHLSFKLAPTYVLYLTARYRASTHFRPELLPTDRAHRLTALLARVAQIIHHVVEERYTDPASLAFWMANAAELLHFLKCDRHISAFSLDAQDILADAVQAAFRHLVACMQCELAAGMASFLSERAEDDTILGILCNAMALLRLCRVNAALTIQFFSHLFHFINMLAFNKIVSSPSNPQGTVYCSRAWGVRLKARVSQLAAWAERQGLELAASCHLGRLAEAAFLLEAPKYNVNDLAKLSSTCLKLNSIQLRALLRGYQPQPDEPRLPLELIDNVVRVAENVADELARSDGREVKLEESPELQLAFVLPEDGFSCDVVRGMHQGLVELIHSLQAAGLCRMSIQPTSSGVWTIYMADPNVHLRSPSSMSNRVPLGQPPLEVQTIRLHKSNNGMGLSIVAAKGAGQDRLGIYIKSVVAGGAADADGRLQAGDQLLKVDGHSLVGITQEKAAEYLVRTGPVVTLEVAKQGAIYHGLATLLSQPSPLMARANASKARHPSERGEQGPPVLPSSVSMMNLQTRPPPPTGLARGSPLPYPSFNGLPAPCIPNIVILDVDADADAASSSVHDSDDPGQSAIFSQIRQVEVKRGPLSREEAERCVAELKAIVDDFERSTQEQDALSLDLTGVLSDSDSSVGVSLDSPPIIHDVSHMDSHDLSSTHSSYHPLDLSRVSDSPPPGSDAHEHRRLVRKPRQTQSLDFIPSVKDLTKRFDDQFCSHRNLALFDPHNDSARLSERNVAQCHGTVNKAHDGRRLSEGKVATLANYFSSLGAAGMIRLGEPSPTHSASEPELASLTAPCVTPSSPRHSLSDPSLNSTLRVSLHTGTQTSPRTSSDTHAETQTSARGCQEAQVQTLQPDYDYSLIYSLISNEKKKKFPKDYIRRRKTNPKWHSTEVLSAKPTDSQTRQQLSVSASDLNSTGEKRVSRTDPVYLYPVADMVRLQEPRRRQALAFPSKLTSSLTRRVAFTRLSKNGPRRMSERDLPSRLQGEEKKPMHSSKSVPSLHTGAQAADQRTQELMHPGYSRTSSSNSIPHAYRSNQNLSDGRHGAQPTLHPAQSTPSLPHSHALYNSTPNNSGYQTTPTSHHPAGQQGYQQSPNVSYPPQGYQPSPNTSYPQQGYQPSPNGPYQQQGYQYPNSATVESQGSPQGSYQQSQPDHPSPGYGGGEGERFYQNLAVYPQHDLARGKAPSAHDLSPGMVQQRGGEVPRERERPASAYLPHYHHQQQEQLAMQGRSQSSRDMLRQEAKLQEMTEEVRRREMRGGAMPRGPLQPQGRSPGPVRAPGHLSPEGYRPRASGHLSPEGYRDPRDPRVARAPGHLSPEGYRDPRPARAPEEYRDSPPPPPPPVTTHPLLQKSLSPDNRYQASTGEAPRGGYYPAAQGDRRQYPYTGTNPWEREEKEKEQARRREAVRQWREQQISELSGLPSRTPQQEEQLRALKLEREFERRAEEAKQEDDDEGEGEEETESSERVQGLLKMAQVQNGPIIRPATASIAQMKLEDVRRTHAAGLNLNLKPSPNKPVVGAGIRDPSHLRLDQLTLNGPSSPSQPQQHQQQQQQQQQFHHYNGHYEKQNGGVPAPPERGSSYSTMQQLSPDPTYMNQSNHSHQPAYSPMNQSQDRTPSHPDRSPAYPSFNQSQERGYSGMNQSQDRSPAYPMNQSQGYPAFSPSQDRSPAYPGMNQSQDRGPASPTGRGTQPPPKRVSFSNAPPPNQKLSPHMERIAEDPNNFINEAETMLQSPTSPEVHNISGNTPGVIGAQEVYRDPRQRLLAEQKQNTAPRVPGPEKLSFKEKMKMFAMETGEDGTPRDKVKISRAQRDIDNINSPNNNNNNTSINNN